MPSIDRKKKSQQNKLLFIFLSTFFVTLITLIYLATVFTPKIDIEVNDTTPFEQETVKEDESMTAEVEYKSIDSRLRDIQMDDKYSVTNTVENTSDLVANLRKMKEETIAKQLKNSESVQVEEDPIALPKNDIIKLEVPKLASPEFVSKQSSISLPSQQAKKVVSSVPKMTKVYVGKYAEFDQAAIVQEALVKSSLVTAPFIKNLNGYYVIQVGSFSNMEAAQNVAELLISNGYSAKMVLE